MPTLNALPAWLRQILVGLAFFVLGGVIAFGYSYRPLHGAKNWQIEQLETRLDEVNRENLVLADEIAGLRASEATRVDPAALEQVEKELGKTRLALAQTEKDLKHSEQKRKEANSGATRWRERYEELRDAQASIAAARTEPRRPDRADSPAESPAIGSGPAVAATEAPARDASPASPLPASPRRPGAGWDPSPPASASEGELDRHDARIPPPAPRLP